MKISARASRETFQANLFHQGRCLLKYIAIPFHYRVMRNMMNISTSTSSPSPTHQNIQPTRADRVMNWQNMSKINSANTIHSSHLFLPDLDGVHAGVFLRWLPGGSYRLFWLPGYAYWSAMFPRLTIKKASKSHRNEKSTPWIISMLPRQILIYAYSFSVERLDAGIIPMQSHQWLFPLHDQQAL